MCMFQLRIQEVPISASITVVLTEGFRRLPQYLRVIVKSASFHIPVIARQ
jgi:hypothetical protein